MTCLVSHTTIDCTDAYALSEWWKAMLGYTDIPGDPNEPGHEECMILDPESGHSLLFIEVPEPPTAAKRIHFDLRPRSGTRDEEVARLVGEGAEVVSDLRGRRGPGTGWVVIADPEVSTAFDLPTPPETTPGWVVFADPEGNQFCVLRSQAEVDASAGWEWRTDLTEPDRA